MNELALFAGIGGGILAGKMLGWRTVCAVERDAYAASVLAAKQNDGLLAPFPIWDDVCSFAGKPWRGLIDIISGGFPCQDISAAGKGVGIAGERSGLWKEMARIVGEVRPQFVFIENSDMLIHRGLDVVLGDLAARGYDARWCVLSAADVGANHIRKRLWILAHTHRAYGARIGLRSGSAAQQSAAYNCGEKVADTLRDGARQRAERQQSGLCSQSSTLADATSQRCHQVEQSIARRTLGKAQLHSPDHRGSARGRRWWQLEPHVGRVADGVPARVDKLKCLGNAQVQLCAATAFRLLIGDL